MLYMLLFGGNAMVSHAEDVRTITDAKVRSQADTGSEQVGSAPQGTILTKEGETQGTDNNVWYQVTVDGKTGFIRSDLTESVDGGSESSGTVAQTDITSGTIGGSSATVRQGPSTSAGKVTSAEAGSTVTVTGEALGDDGSTWYQVDAGGQSGFIRSDLFDENAFVRGGGESPAEGEGEGGEESPEAPAESEGGGEAPAESEGGTKIVNVLSSKVIPDGVDIEDMEVDPETLAGWSSDGYYLLKTKDDEGGSDWYVYMPESGVSKLDLAGGGSFSSLMSGKGKFMVIGAGVVFILLIGVCVMLAVKLRGYQEYDSYGSGRSKSRSRSYDDDDDDEEAYDDEYDEEDDDTYDDDEEYDDEEEYDDDDDDGYDDEEEDDDDAYDDEEEDERPVRKRRWSPKNFLSRHDDEDDEEDDEYEYDDEEDDEDEEEDDEYLDDDDFEFEFLNMDDKDDY